MEKRTYNILFHTHTVSGIIISVVLYVIFFAGSLSFFRDEFVNWERNQSTPVTAGIQLDLNTALDSLDKNYTLYGRDITFTKYYIENRTGVSLTATKDSLANEETKKSHFFYLDTQDYSEHTYINSYTLGEFLYRLHFLAQIPYPFGYYLSGLIAFFFLFAIITGVLVHWKKIVSNFYIFRPMAKLKTIWTDAHTALGMIGLPFQFVYAVTGAFFMIKVFLMAPNIMVLYDGDESHLYKDLEYTPPSYDFENSKINVPLNLNEYVKKTETLWNDFDVTKLYIQNYGDNNMHVTVEGQLDYKAKFTGVGKITYKVATGEIISKKDPVTQTTYLDSVKNILYRLHYGDYGGYALKLISFLLGIISCFVIISGVMIWLVARDKKNIPEKKRRFNERVVRIYLAICLSMYPVTALSFIAVKVCQPVNQSFIYSFYFISWLLAAILLILKKDNFFRNKYTLLSGSILGLLIPVANGIMTGNWIWKSFKHDFQPFFVDAFWITISIITLFVALKLKKKPITE